MQNNFTFVTTNTATMNKDSAKQKHNHRDEYTIKREMEKDPTRSFGDISKDEVWVTLLDEKHKTYTSIVNEIYKSAIDKYNAIQKKNRHTERCKKTYSSYWKDNKKNKCDSPVVEMIVQVGGTHDSGKDYATGLVDPEIGKEILKDFLKQFQERYPLLKVIDCTYHQGEATPHIHLDFIPIAEDEKLGLTASLDKACEQMGFGEKDSKRTTYSVRDFQFDFHRLLDDICESHGIEIEHPGLNRGHESVTLFKENERLRQDQAKLMNTNVAYTNKNRKLHKENAELEAKNADLQKEADSLNTEINDDKKTRDSLKCEIIDLQKVKENKKHELATAEDNLIDFTSKAEEKKRKAQAEIDWYKTRASQVASNEDRVLQILSYLKDVLNELTKRIFSIAGVEFQKTVFTCEDDLITAKYYRLINTTDRKLFVSFNNHDPQKSLNISLAENEKLYYDATMDIFKELERDIVTGTTEVTVTEIDDNDAPERVRPKRVRPDLGFGLVD